LVFCRQLNKNKTGLDFVPVGLYQLTNTDEKNIPVYFTGVFF
jgi:hypothetical protein